MYMQYGLHRTHFLFSIKSKKNTSGSLGEQEALCCGNKKANGYSFSKFSQTFTSVFIT